jgi:hypothetical protein
MLFSQQKVTMVEPTRALRGRDHSVLARSKSSNRPIRMNRRAPPSSAQSTITMRVNCALGGHGATLTCQSSPVARGLRRGCHGSR